MYMLDTNICIYIIKEKPKEVINKFKTFNISDICISSVTAAELHYGVQKSQNVEKNRDALTMFLSPLEILPFDDEAAYEYGIIRADLEKRGEIIGAMDMMIAAHAKALKATIVTNNEKEFRRIPSLNIENWIKYNIIMD